MWSDTERRKPAQKSEHERKNAKERKRKRAQKRVQLLETSRFETSRSGNSQGLRKKAPISFNRLLPPRAMNHGCILPRGGPCVRSRLPVLGDMHPDCFCGGWIVQAFLRRNGSQIPQRRHAMNEKIQLSNKNKKTSLPPHLKKNNCLCAETSWKSSLSAFFACTYFLKMWSWFQKTLWNRGSQNGTNKLLENCSSNCSAWSGGKEIPRNISWVSLELSLGQTCFSSRFLEPCQDAWQATVQVFRKSRCRYPVCLLSPTEADKANVQSSCLLGKRREIPFGQLSLLFPEGEKREIPLLGKSSLLFSVVPRNLKLPCFRGEQANLQISVVLASVCPWSPSP